MKRNVVICILCLIVCVLTGCSHYTFFNEFTHSVEEKTGQDTFQKQVDAQLKLYEQYEQPPAFTEEAIEEMLELDVIKEEKRYDKEDNYPTKDIYTIDKSENPYVVSINDPDVYMNTVHDLLESYFNYYMVQAGGFKDAPDDKKILYMDVLHTKIIAGTIDEFVVETLVDIHVPDVQNTVFAQYGSVGNDNAVHCALTVHGERVTDYTFQLVGLAQSDEVRKHIQTDISYVKTDPIPYNMYGYQIKDGKLSVSYDGETVWKSVPISIDMLFNRGDGNGAKPSQTLESGSFYISPELTVFVYGGSSEMPVTLLISEDEGETWRSVIVNHKNNIRRSFISYVDGSIFVLSCGDRTMGQELSWCYLSTDKGVTWSGVGMPFPEGSFLVLGLAFIDNNNGFITVTSSQCPTVYRTHDGGKIWECVDIPVDKEGYTLAYAPEIVGEQLQLYIGQYEYGEMEGLLVKYISDDKGLNWKKEGWVMR